MRRSAFIHVAVLGSVFLLLAPALAGAATKTFKPFTGRTDDDWHEPTNWIPEGVPTDADDVVIVSGTTTVSAPAQARTVTVDATGGSAFFYVEDGGALALGADLGGIDPDIVLLSPVSNAHLRTRGSGHLSAVGDGVLTIDGNGQSQSYLELENAAPFAAGSHTVELVDLSVFVDASTRLPAALSQVVVRTVDAAQTVVFGTNLDPAVGTTIRVEGDGATWNHSANGTTLPSDIELVDGGRLSVSGTGTLTLGGVLEVGTTTPGVVEVGDGAVLDSTTQSQPWLDDDPGNPGIAGGIWRLTGTLVVDAGQEVHRIDGATVDLRGPNARVALDGAPTIDTLFVAGETTEVQGGGTLAFTGSWSRTLPNGVILRIERDSSMSLSHADVTIAQFGALDVEEGLVQVQLGGSLLLDADGATRLIPGAIDESVLRIASGGLLRSATVDVDVAGTLAVEGTIDGSVAIASSTPGGTLVGAGTIGALDVHASGTVLAGSEADGTGDLLVQGDARFRAGSTLATRRTATGTGMLDVDGELRVDPGATLQLTTSNPPEDPYPTTFDIVTRGSAFDATAFTFEPTQVDPWIWRLEDTSTALTARLDDTQAPTGPAASSSTHTVGVTSTATAVALQLSGATDPHSGLEGFVIAWDQSATTNPTGAITHSSTTGAASATSPQLTPGSWYAHVLTRDRAGNESAALHVGPFVIVAPTTPDPVAPTPDPDPTAQRPVPPTAAQVRLLPDARLRALARRGLVRVSFPVRSTGVRALVQLRLSVREARALGLRPRAGMRFVVIGTGTRPASTAAGRVVVTVRLTRTARTALQRRLRAAAPLPSLRAAVRVQVSNAAGSRAVVGPVLLRR